MNRDEVTKGLVRFVAQPVRNPGALAMMRLSLLDWAACGIAGQSEPVSQIVRQQALADSGAAVATVIGAQQRLPAKAAALVNGTTSHALDYDDTHFGHIGHPSVAVIPAALAMAEVTGADGTAFLQAALVGVEVSIRVGLWLGRGHYQTGFHQTATAGAFGATAAASRLLGLDAAQNAHAFGLVATRASGLKSQFGSMGKPFNAGIAAANGVEAAQLVAAGFLSNPRALEAAQGFGPTHAGTADASALDDLGQRFLFETVSHKFHACCHGLHAALEAIATLRADIGTAEVTEVSITTHPRWLSVCNIAEPASGLEAKFSYRLTAAMALSGHDTAALATFSHTACVDPGLIALRDRVVVQTDDTMPETAARVSLRTTDGQHHVASHDLDAPLTLAERQGKLLTKAGAIVGADTAAALWAAISPTDGPNLPDLTTLLAT